jgi:hypothetical protein
MRPVDVLAARAELWDDIRFNETFKSHVAHVLNARFEAGMETIKDPNLLIPAMESAMRMSEVFLVSEDMAAVAEHAQKTMPGEPFAAHDLPSTHGFMWIEGGIQTPDIRHVINSTTALIWATFGGGVILMGFTWKYDTRDEINANIRRDNQRIPALMPLLTWTGYAMGLRYGEVPEVQIRIADHVEVNTDDVVTVSEDGNGVLVNGEPVDVVDSDPSHEMSWFLAACRLMQQNIARPVREEVPAKKVRRFDLKDTTVTVIKLRHAQHGPCDGESQVEWRHRWVVRGHWRYAHAKDEDGNPIRRWVYINPHFRGPEGAPLLIRDKVNFWNR